MKIDLDKIDFVLYVYLDNKDLLPLCIFKISKNDLMYTNKSKNRVTFQKSFVYSIRKKNSLQIYKINNLVISIKLTQISLVK